MKLQRAAFSAIIWFGDLNAVAPRQLLIWGLDLPDTPAEMEGTGRGKESRAGFLYFLYLPHTGNYDTLYFNLLVFLFFPFPVCLFCLQTFVIEETTVAQPHPQHLSG